MTGAGGACPGFGVSQATHLLTSGLFCIIHMEHSQLPAAFLNRALSGGGVLSVFFFSPPESTDRQLPCLSSEATPVEGWVATGLGRDNGLLSASITLPDFSSDGASNLTVDWILVAAGFIFRDVEVDEEPKANDPIDVVLVCVLDEPAILSGELNLNSV